MTYAFYSVVHDDFEQANRLILDRLSSNISLVEEIGQYLIRAGGKRLRPLLVLLTSRACGYDGDKHVELATIIEFLHTAMLLHDDVVDRSALRRGRATVNANWGNPASVLVGDFLHSRAFQMMVAIGNMQVMEILSQATNTIAEGEVQQLTHIGDVNVSEQDYTDIIYRKTAKLFEASSHSAAALAGVGSEETATLRDFGARVGLAFQLIDDALDYLGDATRLGKNIGDDLAEGKLTLPLIVALREGSDAQRAMLQQAIKEPGTSNLDAVKETVVVTGGADYTLAAATRYRDEALSALEKIAASPFRDAMYNLATFVVQRSH